MEQQVQQSAPVQPKQVVQNPSVSNKPVSVGSQGQAVPQKEKKRSLWWLWLLIGLIVGVLGSWVFSLL